MQVLPRWRNLIGAAASAMPSPTHLASFHSTNIFFEKWKNKFNSDVGRDQQPKNYIRYAVRHKRADTKKALKSILYNGGCSASIREIDAGCPNRVSKKSRIKPAQQAKRVHHKKLKRDHRKESLYDDFNEKREKTFHTTFDKQGFTWTTRQSGIRFDWTEGWSNYSRIRTELENEPFAVGAYADRKVLGLPTSGPLKVDDVKAAFRMSALKWHPDKHQGSSQAEEAEEKFKHCVNAYKSLCAALSTTT